MLNYRAFKGGGWPPGRSRSSTRGERRPPAGVPRSGAGSPSVLSRAAAERTAFSSLEGGGWAHCPPAGAPRSGAGSPSVRSRAAAERTAFSRAAAGRTAFPRAASERTAFPRAEGGGWTHCVPEGGGRRLNALRSRGRRLNAGPLAGRAFTRAAAEEQGRPVQGPVQPARERGLPPAASRGRHPVRGAVLPAQRFQPPAPPAPMS